MPRGKKSVGEEYRSQKPRLQQKALYLMCSISLIEYIERLEKRVEALEKIEKSRVDSLAASG